MLLTTSSTKRPPVAAPPARAVLSYALRLRGIRVAGHVGVGDSERENAQALVVAADVELAGALYPAADELERAADYADVVSAVERMAEDRAYRLLETFALRVAERLAERWPAAQRVRVAVTKALVPVSSPTDEATVEVVLGPVSAV